MERARRTLKTGLPVGLGVLAGVLLATMLAGQPAGAAQVQDPAVQMQIQQALSNFQIQLQSQLNLMLSKIDTLERAQQQTRYRMDTAERDRITAAAPIPADPIPGTTTYGVLTSQVSHSYRYELHSPRGDLLGQLGATADGPGLVLLDAGGQISVALVATPGGPELRMADADGNLQTVLTGR